MPHPAVPVCLAEKLSHIFLKKFQCPMYPENLLSAVHSCCVFLSIFTACKCFPTVIFFIYPGFGNEWHLVSSMNIATCLIT